MDAMPKPRFPHLQREPSRQGVPRFYVRLDRKSPRIRLREPFGTKAFAAEYLDAVRRAMAARDAPPAAAKPAALTLEEAWRLYRQSADWRDLSPATRRQRENIMRHVLDRIGAAPLAEIDRASVTAGRDRRQATPSEANNFLGSLSHLFAWAVHEGHAKANPVEGVKRLRRPKTGGFPHWTPQDEAAFTKRWPIGTQQYLAYMVHACTGLRRGDAVRLAKADIRDGVIHMTAEKNAVGLFIPVHPDLAAAMAACPAKGATILETASGRPWGSKESYGNTFHGWAKAAGIDKNSHGIRKLAATRVADAGASEREMMALFGWTDPAMARVYTEAANRKQLARQAAARLGAGDGELGARLVARRA